MSDITSDSEFFTVWTWILVLSLNFIFRFSFCNLVLSNLLWDLLIYVSWTAITFTGRVGLFLRIKNYLTSFSGVLAIIDQLRRPWLFYSDVAANWSTELGVRELQQWFPNSQQVTLKCLGLLTEFCLHVCFDPHP